MTVKEIVLDSIQNLPSDVTYEDVLEQVAILAAIERGQQAARAGRVLPHDVFKELDHAAIREQLRLAQEDIDAGRFLTQAEMEEEVASWNAESLRRDALEKRQ